MAYRLQAGEPLADGLRRIANEQAAGAIELLEQVEADPEKNIHNARKSLKQTRAVLRMVRSAIGETVYKRENGCYRAAGRAMSSVRDSAVVIETLDALSDWCGSKTMPSEVETIRKHLVDVNKAAVSHALGEADSEADHVDDVVRQLADARERIPEWPLRQKGFDLVAGGLRDSYARGRKTMRKAYRKASSERFHDWRKRVKDLWYHMRIVRVWWDAPLGTLADQVHDLASLLGIEHDLSVLEESCRSNAAIREEGISLDGLTACIRNRQDDLRASARPLGDRIYAEKPKAFLKRLHAYYSAQQG